MSGMCGRSKARSISTADYPQAEPLSGYSPKAHGSEQRKVRKQQNPSWRLGFVLDGLHTGEYNVRMKRLQTPIIDVKKYGGRQVALVRGRIVASGRSTQALLELAKRRVPSKDHGEIWLFTVPRGLHFIYFFTVHEAHRSLRNPNRRKRRRRGSAGRTRKGKKR